MITDEYVDDGYGKILSDEGGEELMRQESNRRLVRRLAREIEETFGKVRLTYGGKHPETSRNHDNGK